MKTEINPYTDKMDWMKNSTKNRKIIQFKIFIIQTAIQAIFQSTTALRIYQQNMHTKINSHTYYLVEVITSD